MTKNQPNNQQTKTPKRIEPTYPEREPFNFAEDANWRIFRIMAEFIEGFQFLADLKKEVTFFGSARLPENDENYQQAYKLAKILGDEGFSIITGGGPGIMEAGNRGAMAASSVSIGLNIQLPFEQRINPYVTRGIGFHYFFTRKVMLSASSQAYIYFPGGFGTLDEFFEIITLIQTKKMEPIPVILVGKDFWQPLYKYMTETLYKKYKTIAKQDLDLFHIVADAEEAAVVVRQSKERIYF